MFKCPIAFFLLSFINLKFKYHSLTDSYISQKNGTMYGTEI